MLQLRQNAMALIAGVVVISVVPGWGRAAESRRIRRVQAEDVAKSPAARPLGLADFEQLALQHNPTLVQARAQIEISRSKALQAGLYLNPMIGTESEQMGSRGVPGAALGERQGGFIQQEIVTAGKLKLSRSKYQQEAYQAEIQSQAQQLRIVNGLYLAYYDALADQRLIEVHHELLENADDAVKTTAEMVNVGQANRPDLIQARIESRRARVDLKTAENNYRKAWEHLITLAGTPELAVRPLDGALELAGDPIQWDAALTRLFQESPELRFACSEVTRDEITLKRERAEPIPNLNIRAATGYNFETRATTADASLFIRVPLFDRNQGTIKQAEWELVRARAEITRVELSLRKRLADAFARYENARASADDYREFSLPESREAYRLQMDQFRKQRQAWPAVLVAERTDRQMNVEYVKTLLELRRAEVEINGLLLVDGLTEAQGPRPGGHIDATPRPR